MIWWLTEVRRCRSTVLSCSARLQVVLQDYKLFYKTTSCSARLQVVLQDYKLFWKTTSCSGRLQVVLEDYKLFWKTTSCSGRLQVGLQDYKFDTARRRKQQFCVVRKNNKLLSNNSLTVFLTSNCIEIFISVCTNTTCTAKMLTQFLPMFVSFRWRISLCLLNNFLYIGAL